MSRKYNHIYSRLVESKGDIIGHIAYALYKDDKIEYISHFKEEHNGKEPDEDDLKPFNDISSTESSIDKYKYIASRILQSFLDNTLEETKFQIEEELNKNHIALIKETIKPLIPPSTAKSYFHGTMQSIIGAFLFMVLMCALVFIVNLSTHKFTITIGGSGNAIMEQADAAKQDNIQEYKQEKIKPLSNR